jgi:hypothetical protein
VYVYIQAARDRQAPRSFLRIGDRLTFRNGILLLSVTSAAIYIVFRGTTGSLLPLYAVGVFLAFTLSQTGMIVPVEVMDRAGLQALAYAAALGQPAFALHISPTAEEADRFLGYWRAWGDHLALEVIVSPHRAVVAPWSTTSGPCTSNGPTLH